LVGRVGPVDGRRRSGVCHFFFQAEDGIRDRTVTGVQTCALPILFIASAVFPMLGRAAITIISAACIPLVIRSNSTKPVEMPVIRSEERRVGKERSDM